MRTRFAIILVLALSAALFVSAVQAMPEYANQVGEPCGTCHISAAGGGLRSPRGQAWVAQQKPAAVPSLEESLAILGVKVSGDPADYVAPSAPPPPAAPLATRYDRKMWLVEVLMGYAGN